MQWLEIIGLFGKAYLISLVIAWTRTSLFLKYR